MKRKQNTEYLEKAAITYGSIPGIIAGAILSFYKLYALIFSFALALVLLLIYLLTMHEEINK